MLSDYARFSIHYHAAPQSRQSAGFGSGCGVYHRGQWQWPNVQQHQVPQLQSGGHYASHCPRTASEAESGGETAAMAGEGNKHLLVME